MHTWQPRRAFLHGTRGTSTLCLDSRRGACDILKLVVQTTPLSCPDVLSEPSASVLTKSLGRETQAIIVYTARSMLDETLLSHFRHPVTAYILPPAERKGKDDGKSSLPQFLTAACRTMMTLPPLQYHHDEPKSLPTIKGDRAPDTIKGPHIVKGGKCSYSKKRID